MPAYRSSENTLAFRRLLYIYIYIMNLIWASYRRIISSYNWSRSIYVSYFLKCHANQQSVIRMCRGKERRVRFLFSLSAERRKFFSLPAQSRVWESKRRNETIYVEADTKVEKHIAKGSYSMINTVAVSRNDTLFTRYSILLIRVSSKAQVDWSFGRKGKFTHK